MTDKRFYNGIELKKDLLWFKNIDHIPHITDIVLGYNTILEENEQLKKFKKQAYSIINNKINELAMTTSYGDVHNDLRVFAQKVLIDVKKEFDNPNENCKVNVE